MKILVTGGSGFIGRGLVKRLKKTHQLVCLIRETTDRTFFYEEKIPCIVDNNNFDDLLESIKKENIEGVIHLASLFLSSHAGKDLDGLIESNVLFGTRLLEASVNSSIKWFLNTGTFWQHYNDESYSPVNLYAATKQAFESIAKYYYESSKLSFVTLYLSDTYGRGDSRKKVMNLFYDVATSGKSLNMSPGEQKISINHIDDVVSAFEKLVHLLEKDEEKKLSGDFFNVTSEDICTLKDLADIFSSTIGRPLKINWGSREYRPREVMTPWTVVKPVPGWRQEVSLRKGIRDTFC